MNNQAIINIEGLGKRYRLGGATPLGDNLRADIVAWAKGMLKGRRPKAATHSAQPSISSHETFQQIHERHIAEDPNYFWALKDINLEIKQGEVVGIIGRNGAGKSTLLKILSRITPPTVGKITIHGRVASLLEVGTGFHRELTGRENVFLNGSILGMKRADIAKKFDEIVAFAEVEKFIDTPVKFYSSGMYVRLAFAVAAHLEPDILIVDEVLAVGDAAFQRKCLGKMEDVSRQGRTVLFVSHNMAGIRTLCSRGMYLEGGRAVFSGKADDAVTRYLTGSTSQTHISIKDRQDRSGNGKLRFTSVAFLDRSDTPVEEITSGDPLTIQADFETNAPIDHRRFIFTLSLWDEYRNAVALFASDEMGTQFGPIGERGRVRLQLPQFLLRGGSYSVKLFASHNTTAPENFLDVIENAATLLVLPGDFWKSGCTNRPGSFPVIPATLTNATPV